MSLLNLPAELVIAIMKDIIYNIGMLEAAKLRTTCKRFDVFMLDAVHALPIFEDEHGMSADHLRKYRMTKAMIAGLIVAKMKTGNMEKRPLCLAIKKAVDILTTETTQQRCTSPPSYSDILATAAARTMSFSDIIRCLSPNSRVETKANGDIDDAAIAAIYAGNESLVKAMLEKGAVVSAKTRFFGEPMSAAAGTGSQTITLLLLKSLTAEPVSPYFLALRRMNAFKAAAADGHQNLLSTLLAIDGFVANPSHLYDRAVRAAIENGHNSTLLLLLQYRKKLPSLEKEEELWHEIFSLAARRNQARVLEILLNDGSPTFGSYFGQVLEVAFQHGATQVIPLLLSMHSFRPLTYLDSALFWAGRLGNAEALDLIQSHTTDLHVNSLVSALAGAVPTGNMDMVNRILERGTSLSSADDQAISEIALSRRLGDAVDLLLNHGSEPVVDEELKTLPTTALLPGSDPSHLPSLHPPVPLLPDDAQDLMDFARKGSIRQVKRLIKKMRLKKTRCAADDINTASASAAEGTRPGVLSYILEHSNTPRFNVKLAIRSRSMAIFQVYIDHGWFINKEKDIMFSPALPDVIHDENLTRWFLEHGADPNATCGWTITPLSKAAREAPVSTIQLLLEYGASVTGGYLLHFAVRRETPDQLEVIELFLHLGCPINELLFKGCPPAFLDQKYVGTPLHYAVRLRKIEVAAYLLKNGADYRVKDRRGRNALEYAQGPMHDYIAGLVGAM